MLQLKVASLFFFSGLAVVVALVVVVYFVAWVYDRASGASGAFLTPTELEERRVASTVVKEAGLAGLLPDEKNKVMRHFFQENSSVYRKQQHDIESPQDELKAGKDDKDAKRHSKPRNDRCCEGTNSSCCEDSNDLDPESKNEQSNVTRHQIFGTSDRHGKQKEREEDKEIESPENDEDKDHQDGVCPICLVEFENDESVLKGSSCGHMFHLECFMQWVEKNHTDCPLCRADMMTAENFLASAYEVLGEQRVNKMKHINEEAARRLATFEANHRAREESSHDEPSSSELDGPSVRRDPPARLAPTSVADTSMLTIVMVQ